MRDWVLSNVLEPSAYGTHSMLRTKVTKMDSTVRYLGVDLDDALSLSEGIDL